MHDHEDSDVPFRDGSWGMQRTFVKIPEKEYGRNREQLVREDERTADRDTPARKEAVERGEKNFQPVEK